LDSESFAFAFLSASPACRFRPLNGAYHRLSMSPKQSAEAELRRRKAAAELPHSK